MGEFVNVISAFELHRLELLQPCFGNPLAVIHDVAANLQRTSGMVGMAGDLHGYASGPGLTPLPSYTPPQGVVKSFPSLSLTHTGRTS